MRGLLEGLLLMSLGACATNAGEGKTRDQLVQELNGIAANCSPAGKVRFELIGRTELRVQASPSASFEEVDCFLAGIRPYRFDLGFVGNEQYEDR